MIKALKFGGTSMANAKSITQVCDIIKADEEAKFVVVSAPGKRVSTDIKVTDLLIKLYKEQDEQGKKTVLSEIKSRFDDIINDLSLKLDLTEEYDNIWNKIANGASYDYIVSRGEFLSAKVLANVLGYAFVDAAEIIRFYADGTLNLELTQEIASKKLLGLGAAVIPGFYGMEEGGEIKAFSRGGSDVSGAIVARAVGASVYENWTDVDGFMVADPRIVKTPRIIDMLSYRELRELSYMGASVLHTDSVFPVRKANIPIHIRNTFCPSARGTMIVPSKMMLEGKFVREQRTITGIAGKKNFVGIYIEKQMMNGEIGFCKELLDILYNHRVSLEHMPTGIDTVTLIIDASGTDDTELDAMINDINRICKPNTIEMTKSLALVAVVGHGMNKKKGTASRVCKSLSDADINIRMIDQGSSEMNIIVAVENADYEKAISALYDEFNR